jgi:hypothetical protein
MTDYEARRAELIRDFAARDKALREKQKQRREAMEQAQRTPVALEEARKRAEEREAKRKLGLRLLRIGYKELTRFTVTDERARQLKDIMKQLRASL